MSKYLLIIRHAEADWPQNISSDFERPLLPKGESDARNLGAFLAENKISPELVVCSPAKRTIDTFNIINEKLTLEQNKIIFEKKIYEASLKTLLEIVNNFDDANNTVALVGHNSGISELAVYLTDKFIIMPTSGTLLIEFPFESWQMLSSGTGEIILKYRIEK